MSLEKHSKQLIVTNETTQYNKYRCRRLHGKSRELAQPLSQRVEVAQRREGMWPGQHESIYFGLAPAPRMWSPGSPCEARGLRLAPQASGSLNSNPYLLSCKVENKPRFPALPSREEAPPSVVTFPPGAWPQVHY